MGATAALPAVAGLGAGSAPSRGLAAGNDAAVGFLSGAAGVLAVSGTDVGAAAGAGTGSGVGSATAFAGALCPAAVSCTVAAGIAAGVAADGAAVAGSTAVTAAAGLAGAKNEGTGVLGTGAAGAGVATIGGGPLSSGLTIAGGPSSSIDAAAAAPLAADRATDLEPVLPAATRRWSLLGAAACTGARLSATRPTINQCGRKACWAGSPDCAAGHIGGAPALSRRAVVDPVGACGRKLILIVFNLDFLKQSALLTQHLTRCFGPKRR